MQRGSVATQSPFVTREKVLGVLGVGFAVVFASLLAAAYIGWQSTDLMRESAANLGQQQLATLQVLDRIQSGQVALRMVFHRIIQDPNSVNPEDIFHELDDAEREIQQLASAALGTPEEKSWQDLQAAILAFSREARRVVELRDPTPPDSASLFHQQQTVMFTVRQLMSVSYTNAQAVQQRLGERAEQIDQQTTYLLAACFAVAFMGTFFSVKLANNLFKRMEDQTDELNRVSWQLLEKQELAAQRFSHELHDELGQTLAALRTNLQALHPKSPDGRARVADCIGLVDGGIESVREMSQLLHPRVLDDFGLVGGLRWLCERFSQRTGIQVDFDASFEGRMSDELRTHVFRIAQEALTNAARHSSATLIQVHLGANGAAVTLSIRDNGKGIQPARNGEPRGMGLLGMRARARMAGGRLTIQSDNGKGTLVVVAVPFVAEYDGGKKNTYSVG
jgi:signal transduction histidine kinase